MVEKAKGAGLLRPASGLASQLAGVVSPRAVPWSRRRRKQSRPTPMQDARKAGVRDYRRVAGAVSTKGGLRRDPSRTGTVSL